MSTAFFFNGWEVTPTPGAAMPWLARCEDGRALPLPGNAEMSRCEARDVLASLLPARDQGSLSAAHEHTMMPLTAFHDGGRTEARGSTTYSYCTARHSELGSI